jgi:alkanesulfonate monooxygenase SsuD/methylene tetrahydromethanopterin reductase-like flavin-dependent oxidoreductase (luciferase family)
LNRIPSAAIRIWLGGEHERALRRAARLADGFVSLHEPARDVPRVIRYLRESGREATHFGVTVRLPVTTGGPEDWIKDARQLQAMGVTEIGVWTPDLQGDAALRRLIEAKRVLAGALGEE